MSMSGVYRTESGLTDAAWSKLYPYFLEFRKEVNVKNEDTTRRFVERVFWVIRTGGQWRSLGDDWNAVYRRFADWAKLGIWYKMLYYFQKEPDMEFIMVDSTILRAHACSAGAKKGGLNTD